MKKIYLVRHGEAHQNTIGERDFDRELTAQGLADVQKLGVYLKEQLKNIDAIICSSSIRTLTTARLIAERLKFDLEHIESKEEIYDASVRSLFQFILHLDSLYNHIIIVGHNPTVSYIAESLTGEAIGTIPPGGVVIINFENQKWAEVSQHSGNLETYAFPPTYDES